MQDYPSHYAYDTKWDTILDISDWYHITLSSWKKTKQVYLQLVSRLPGAISDLRGRIWMNNNLQLRHEQEALMVITLL